jgi:parvulin-like peptidyl-prolyl isomerase
MITDKTLKTLGGVAAILVVLSAWVGSQKPTVEFEFQAGQLLVDNIDPAQIATIEIAHGEDAVTMKRAGKGFLLASMRNYPASTKEVNNLIRAVLGIRCAAQISEDAETHAELKVADGGAETTTVKFVDADGKALIGVAVSDSLEGQQYARLLTADTVFRTEEFVSLRQKGLDYVDKQLLQVQRDQIAKVEVAPAEGPPYTVESPEAGKVELRGIPDGKKAKGSEADGVFGAATYLNFTEFKSEADAAELQFGNVYTLTTRARAEYVFELAKQDEKWWLRARARYTGPQNVSVPELAPDATDEQRKANDELLKQNEAFLEASKAVQTFNDRHQSWVYELSSWKAESMTKGFDQLVEDDDGKPEKVTASHILIPYQGAQNAAADLTRTQDEARKLAEDLHAQVLADPAQFADLARANSSCPSAEKGGDLGEFAFEAMAKPFSEAAFALEVGGISEVVETEFGYHVILRTN